MSNNNEMNTAREPSHDFKGDMVSFKEGLIRLINKHSIENECDMPDFILAEMVCAFISSCGPAIKKNLDWHGCDSPCHPKRESLT